MISGRPTGSSVPRYPVKRHVGCGRFKGQTIRSSPGTAGTILRGNSGIGLAKIGPDGGCLVSTVLGGTGGENPDGIQVDAAGRILLVTETNSTDFPLPPGVAHQPASGTWTEVTRTGTLTADQPRSSPTPFHRPIGASTR